MKLPFSLLVLIGLGLGLAAGIAEIELVHVFACGVAELFLRLLKLVSLPIIFLSLLSTLSGMQSIQEFSRIGRKTLQYTLITTLIAASIALGFFQLIQPTGAAVASDAPQISVSYSNHLFSIIPQDFISPFLEGSVISVLFLAIILSFAILTLDEEHKKPLHQLAAAAFATVMRVTQGVLKFMPIAVFAFAEQFVHDLRSASDLQSMALYLVCLLAANLVQAVVILPVILKIHGKNPLKLFTQMLPALTVAFFSKSSAAAMPAAIDSATRHAGIRSETARFTFPLCATINMNACAAFILITVLFVAGQHGVVFSPLELISWIGIATLAALGNAGVPMGCYMMASAFLVSMGVPIQMMGLILPFYSLIDMLESGINVWSDACVTAIVDTQLQQETGFARY